MDTVIQKVIEVKDISLTISKNAILDHVSIEVRNGEICGLIGRNGSGKTVLMKCICGFMIPDEGEIVVNNKRISKDIDFIKDAGIIIETPGFIPTMSGYRNLKSLAMIRGVIGKEEIEASLKRVGLDPNMKKHVRKYSLGMKQRLGLAQAIMENPSILILDEPFNGLDRDGVLDMRKYLLEFKKEGKTILISSHSAEDISVLCDRVYEMDKGKVISEKNQLTE